MRAIDHPAPSVAATRRRRATFRAMAPAAALVLLAGACSGTTAAASRSANTPDARTVAAPAGSDVATRPPTAAETALVTARPYTLRVPPAAPNPAPLVIVLHGYGASGAIQAGYLDIAPVTDARGMMLAVVDGTRDRTGREFWNATDACCGDGRGHVDDVAYLRAVIADVAARHPVDPQRVYFVGHSNGGFMSYRMACDHAGTVAAIVSLEAATWKDPERCHPSEGVAVLEIHGTGDETIAYDGGTIDGRRYPGAKRSARMWARNEGCSPVPEHPAPAPHAIEVLLRPASVTAYSTGCRKNGHVELWTQRGGVHVPPLAATFSAQVVDYLLAYPKS